MATKSKSSGTTRKKPTRKPKKGRKGSSILTLVLIIAIVALAGSYFYITYTTEKALEGVFSPITTLFSSQNDSTDQVTVEQSQEVVEAPKELPKEEKPVIISPLEGTWVSTLNGAMLSFEANLFKLEFPSVEERATLEGHFKILDGKLHLVNTLSDDVCGMENGIYSFQLNGEDLILDAENDPCKMRKENLSTDWFKL
ncbi:MAG: hypothetical protein H0S84_05230 [Bacteroidales bacterium]|jgi:hypothetical protein|nr:hypothetical protein [Bacteroidales bacterium]